MRETSAIRRALAAARRADLARIDADYDPAACLLMRAPYDNRTHSACTAPQVHVVRESFYAAASLLRAARPGDEARAIALLERLCQMQDSRATSRSFGVWPYYAEEPLDELPAPDVNWADFCGNAIISILADHGRKLPETLRSRLRTAARNAAWAVFRRNVTPDYTNIALMGAVLTLRVGESDGESALISYGREKISAMEQRLQYHGGFTEYNSPTYTLVAVEELERLFSLVRDAGARVSARRLHVAFWAMLAAHYHPRTGQLCGPLSRAYQDDLSDDHLLFVARRLGEWPVPHHGAPAASAPELVAAKPIPKDLRGAFLGQHRLPGGTRRQTLQRLADGTRVTSAVWRSRDACLGSVSHGTGWMQARPLLGRLASRTEGWGTLRLRMLANGEDFASGEIYTEQHEGSALILAGVGRNRGSYHLYLDRPADGMIELSSLVLRLELRGKEAVARRIERKAELVWGDWRVLLRGGGRWQAKTAALRIVKIDGGVAGEVVLFEGAAQRMHYDDLPGAFAWMALTISRSQRPRTVRPPPRLSRARRIIRINWDGAAPLRVVADMTAPRRLVSPNRLCSF